MNIHDLFNFKSFIKFLNKNKLYTFIEIFGMSVSFLFVIVIITYTRQEFSTDDFQENKDRLYVMANQESLGMAYRLADKLKDNFPEIEAVCPMVNYFKKIRATVGSNNFNADLLFADSTFFDLFSFQLKEGNKENVLDARNYALVSETFANKAFPNIDPLGQTIQLNNSVRLIVTGVMKDITHSIIPYGDILLRIDNIKHFNPSLDSESYSNIGATPIILLTKPNSNIEAKTEETLSYLKENVWTYRNKVDTAVAFIPLKEVYFSSLEGHDGLIFNQGNKNFVLILVTTGILILLFAIINYINLTVAQTGFRAKEMATRRLLGSSRAELFCRLMLESSLLSLISFLIGLLFAFAVVPYVNDLLQTHIRLSGMVTPRSALTSLILVLFIGGLAGLLPALIISNAQPVEIVKGTLRKQTKMVFSKIFITFQHIITIALITASLIMVLQTNHLINAPLGYNTSNIINIPTEGSMEKQTIRTLVNELNKSASVKRIAYSQGIPFDGGNSHTVKYPNKNIRFYTFDTDTAFVNMLGIQITKDNQLAGSGGYYLNRQALKELEISEDVLTFPYYDKQEPIAGIMEDFRIRNIAYEKHPVLLQIKDYSDLDEIWNVLVEVEGDPLHAYNEVKNVYEQVTKLEFAGKYLDEEIRESFSQQTKTAKIIVLFACIATLLSLLGLTAMSTYFIQQRSGEIAVRKVFGSSISEILNRLIFTFLNYVVIAFVIATPFMWYIMKQWLFGYSYRISLSPWIFIASGLFCLLLSFITVFRQSYRAAHQNPVRSIKRE